MPGNIVNLTPADVAKWPKPNYEDPERRTWLPAYVVAFWVVGTIMVGTRFWLRLKGQAGRLGLDDALLLPGWLFGGMFTAAAIMLTMWADGDIIHIWDVMPTRWERIAEALWFGEFAFLLAGGFTKVSVLMFYRRLVDGTYSRRWKYAVLAAIAFTVAYTIAFLVLLLINCNPTKAYWKAFDPVYAATASYTCMDTKVINTLAGVFASLSDLYAVALPCAITWSFSIPRPQKIALNVIFSLGLLVIAASGVRTYYLIETGMNQNISTNIFNTFVWAQLELQLGIMCSSAPSLRVLFRKWGMSGAVSRAFEVARKSAPSRTDNKSKSSITVVRQTSVTSNSAAHPHAYSPDDMAKQPLETVDEYDADQRSYSSAPSDDRPTRLSHEHEPDAYPLRELEKPSLGLRSR